MVSKNGTSALAVLPESSEGAVVKKESYPSLVVVLLKISPQWMQVPTLALVACYGNCFKSFLLCNSITGAMFQVATCNGNSSQEVAWVEEAGPLVL